MEKFEPKNGDQVWIKVFSNWSSGIYIGLDDDGISHLVREPKEGGHHLFKGPEILPITENPNDVHKVSTMKAIYFTGQYWQWMYLPECDLKATLEQNLKTLSPIIIVNEISDAKYLLPGIEIHEEKITYTFKVP